MTQTKSQIVAADVAALLRARNPLIWIVTREESRVETNIVQAAAAAGYGACTWDVAQGARTIDGARVPGSDGTEDVSAMFAMIKAQSENVQRAQRCVWIMRDLAPWLQGPIGMVTLRQLRNLARALPGTGRSTSQAIVVLTTSPNVPDELEGHAVVIEWPLPDREEIAAILDAAITALPENDEKGVPVRGPATPINGVREAAIDAAVGLSGEEAAACFAKSLVQIRKIDPPLITKEKRRVISKAGVLEWFEPLSGGLGAVGGLDNLKDWLIARRAAYSPRARAYGLPAPKGALLVGVPGCGKSLTAKAVATAWGVPLLRMDLGALKSKYVGESEGNLRKAFQIIEAMGRCVVWLDEIEKALAGATQGAADGGVSSDALGAILGWMQDRSGQAFVVATANDISALPPELLRKGRFDEVWFVDLPNPDERASILSAALRAHGRDTKTLVSKEQDSAAVVAATEGFSGAEIAALVPDAMYTAFGDGEREITVDDLWFAARQTVPSTRTSAEKIEKLREWSRSGRARLATRTVSKAETTQGTGRKLDI